MAVGDLRGLSSNAQTMVKMAVLSAWAELQVARTDQKYLDNVLEPHLGKLLPLWLASLQEFARLRFEPDISNHTAALGAEESLETVYSALNRQTLLKVIQVPQKANMPADMGDSSTKIRGLNWSML